MSKHEVYAELFDAHWPAVLGYMRRRVADREEAEEIAADVFRIAWEKLDPHDPFGRPWLIATAMNRLRDHYRRRHRRTEAERALARLIEEQPHRADIEDLVGLRQAMSSLAEREREAVLLTYWDGLSATEVAEVLGCQPGAVWTLLSRARGKLRATFDISIESGGVSDVIRTRR